MEPEARPPSAAAVFAWSTAAVVPAALVGLPLFQDGASYLFELVMTGSAVRHHRVSAWPFQLPAMLVRRVAPPDGTGLAAVRTAFALGYALVPVLALALVWVIVRRERPGAIVWPGLAILFVNLVDWSWVSELLIAMQLAWPLLLVWIAVPPGGAVSARRGLVFTLILLPTVWLLHPLSALLLATIAVACVVVARRDPARRRVAMAAAGAHAVAALTRAAAAPLMLSSYESSFLEPPELVGYLLVSHWENVIVLAAALAIGAIVVRTDGRGANRAALALAFVAAGILVSRYVEPTHTFPLKTGLAVLTSAALMLLAAFDATLPTSPERERARIGLTRGLALVFAAVVGAKSLVWHTATARLAQTLEPSAGRCREMGELSWLAQAPYAVVNNWALPSLALVTQDRTPRALLLANGDCARFRETGMVAIDPWTTLPATALVPSLD